jgi:hypothetical protein
MLSGDATEQPSPYFRGQLDGLDSSRSSNQAIGEGLRAKGSGDWCCAIKVLRNLDEMIRQEFG